MSSYEGTVSRVFVKDWNGTNLYSFKLEGNDEFFNTGDKSPGIAQGDVIKFTADLKGKRTVADIPSIEKVAVAPKATGGAAPSKQAAVDWDAKDRGIQYQGAGKIAAAILQAAAAGGVLPFTKAALEKPNKKMYETFESMAATLTNKIYHATIKAKDDEVPLDWDNLEDSVPDNLFEDADDAPETQDDF
jgi:hypothetical protein